MRTAYVSPDAEIGINGYIGFNVHIFNNCKLGPNVTICDDLDILAGSIVPDNTFVIDVPNTTDLVEIMDDFRSIAEVKEVELKSRVDEILQSPK